MTTGTLRQPGIKERVEQLGYLLKHTFSLVGRDPGILRPWIRMSLYAVVMVSLFFYSVISIWGNNGGTLSLLLSLGMFVYKYFYYTLLHTPGAVTELAGDQGTAGPPRLRRGR